MIVSGREKFIWFIGSALLYLFIIVQFIPIGWFVPSMELVNQPIRHQIQWSSPEADDLMKNICYVCHSNETRLPIYAQIAPISWIAARNVNEARQHLNFSEVVPQNLDARLLVAYIQSNLMPPPAYRLMHPEANLSQQQKQILIDAIRTVIFHCLSPASPT
jgi:hypothetical protein